MRFAIFNINFHTSHHLLPRVPAVRLAELDRQVALSATRRAPGYLAFHRQVLAAIPWRARPGAPAAPSADMPDQA